MAVYVVAQLKFTNRPAYDRYQARFMEAMKGFKGRLLAADEHPELLEGEWDREKLVLIAFPDETSFREWETSPLYQEISKDRRAGADATVLLVKGLPG